MRYSLTREAEWNLEEIFVEGIIKFGEIQALKYQESFSRTFELLSELPRLGRGSERGIVNEHRFLHGVHVIFYQIEADWIVITALVDGRCITDSWGD